MATRLADLVVQGARIWTGDTVAAAVPSAFAAVRVNHMSSTYARAIASATQKPDKPPSSAK
jgi:hypothetical protein